MVNYFSEFDYKDVAALLPEVANVVGINTEYLQRSLQGIREKHTGVVLEIMQRSAELKAKAAADPAFLFSVLRRLEEEALQSRRLGVYENTMEHLLPHRLPELRQEQAAREAKDTGSPLTVAFWDMLGVMPQWGVKERGIAASDPDFLRYETLLAQHKKAVPQEHGTVSIDASRFNQQAYEKALTELAWINTPPASPEEKEKLAGIASVIIGHRQASLELAGSPKVSSHFSKMNRVDEDITSTLGYRVWIERGQRLMGEFNYLHAQAPAKINNRVKSYGWDEAKQIVINAYGQLGPEIKAIAERAFNEHWLAVYEIPPGSAGDAHTLIGLPSSQVRNGHPYIVSPFSGTPGNVQLIGHEMAHAIAYFLAGRKHGVFSDTSATLIHEHFAALGERLVEQEMFKRARTPRERFMARFSALDREGAQLANLPLIETEAELYDLTRGKPAFRYEDMRQIYAQKMDRFRIHGNIDNDLYNMIKGSARYEPLNRLHYPIANLAADAMMEELKSRPAPFRRHYREAMQAGGTIDITDLWDKTIGKGKVDGAFFGAQAEKFVQRAEALRRELDALPDYDPSQERPHGADGHAQKQAGRSRSRSAQKR